jgi:Tol biopolymer transport system component
VSVSSAGRGANRGSYLEDISGDGRFVLFLTRASNLVPRDTNDSTDLFLHDTVGHTTRRVSVGSGGRQANGGVWEGALSGNGRWLVFVSAATNLVPAATVADRPQVYLHNLRTGRTTLLSRNGDGEAANAGSVGASVSRDGRYVAFESAASNLGPRADDSPRSKIFVRDRFDGRTRVVSLNPEGQLLRRDSQFPDISADGSVVAWAAGRFDRGGPRYTTYAWDRDTKTSELISVRQSGADSFNRSLGSVSVSGDGRLVLFSSNDSLGGDEQGQPDPFGPDPDVFIRDREERTTTLVTHPLLDDPLIPQGSVASEIATNGVWALFVSDEDTLIDGDTNGVSDLFVQRIGSRDERAR